MAAVAKIVPVIDIPELCDHASLIVVGRADKVRADGPTTLVENGTNYPGRLMEVEFKVERALKGASGGTVSFAFTVPTVPIVGVGGAGVAPGQFGVFFLGNGPGGYEVLNPDYPFVVAAPGAPETSGGALDKVTAEIAHVLDAHEASARDKQHAISLLAMLQTRAATEALKTAARSQPVNLRLLAMGVLLGQNDISFLPEAQKLFLSSDSSIDRGSRDSAASAMGFGVRDPRAIPLLVQLLHSDDVYVRRGAASALRNTYDGGAIKPLTDALYDSDREVRYYAVVGLGEITGQNEWTPSVGYFDQNEQRFLKYWRDWAKSRK